MRLVLRQWVGVGGQEAESSCSAAAAENEWCVISAVWKMKEMERGYGQVVAGHTLE